MKDEFTTFDIINKLGIPRGRLREWINEGFIVPSVQKAEGVGTKALFDRVDIITLVIFKHLIEAHKIARSEAAQIANEWAEVVHRFKKEFGEEHFQDFLKKYPHLIIMRTKGGLIVGRLVVGYILTYHTPEGDLRKKLWDVFGKKNIRSALSSAELLLWAQGAMMAEKAVSILKTEKASKRLIDEFSRPLDYDSILQINFRKILDEAERLFE